MLSQDNVKGLIFKPNYPSTKNAKVDVLSHMSMTRSSRKKSSKVEQYLICISRLTVNI